MRKILYLFKIIVGLASDLSQVVGYICTFLSALFCSRVTLATRVLAAESQLAACKRRIEKKDRPRPRFTQAFRLLWVLLSKAWDQWHQVAHLMQPATVKRWHTTAFRCSPPRSSAGTPQPSVAPQVERSDGPASSVEGDAGSDSSTQPRESPLECRTNRGHIAPSRLRSPVQRQHPQVHVSSQDI